MSSLASLLPNDLLSSILLEWIGYINDFIALDSSFTNRILREKYLDCCQSNSKSSGLTAPISIKSCEVIKKVIAWKEKRRLVLNELSLRRTSVEIDKYLIDFYDLKKLETTSFGMKNCYFHINTIFSGMFYRLEELHFSLSDLSYDKKLLGVVKPTKIRKLVILFCNVFPLSSPISETPIVANAQDLSQFSEWVGKCCPLVESLELTMKIKICPYVFLDMFSNMKNLSSLKYDVTYDIASVDTSLLSLRTKYQFRSVKKLVIGRSSSLVILSFFPSLEELNLTLNGTEENSLRVVLEWMQLYGQQLKCLKLCFVTKVESPLVNSIYQSVAENCTSLKELGTSLWDGGMEIITQGYALKKLTTLKIFDGNCNQSHEMARLCQASHFINQLECIFIGGCNWLLFDDILNIVSSFPSCTKLEWELFHTNFSDEADDENQEEDQEEDENHEEDEIDENDHRAYNIVQFFTTLMTHKNLQQLSLRFDMEDELQSKKDYYDFTIHDDKIVKEWHFEFPHLTFLKLKFPFVFISWTNYLLQSRLLKNCPNLEYLDFQFVPENVKWWGPKYEGKAAIEKLRTTLLQ